MCIFLGYVKQSDVARWPPPFGCVSRRLRGPAREIHHTLRVGVGEVEGLGLHFRDATWARRAHLGLGAGT